MWPAEVRTGGFCVFRKNVRFRPRFPLMVVVYAVMWPGGDASKAYLLQTMTITNTGREITASPGTFQYNVRLGHSTTFKPNAPSILTGGAPWRVGACTHHRSHAPMTLVLHALRAVMK